MTTTVLITGAAGFIGSHVAEYALRRGWRVVALDDLSGGFERNVPAGVTFVKGSVTDAAFVSEVWKAYGPFSYVYHLAAYAAEGLSHFIRRYNYTNNVIGSMNLINESVRNDVRCFVFTSSIAVYGKNQLPMREELTPQPEDPYGIAKYAVELDLAAAHAMFGLDYVIFRPHNVYGERQNIADRYRNVVGIFMNQLMNDQPMTIFGDGMQTRAFSHIDDVAPHIVAAPATPAALNRVFNVGADKPYSVLELAHTIADVLGVSPALKHLPSRHEVVHAFADHSKVRQAFSIGESHVSLEEGIQRMAAWVRKVGSSTPVTYEGIEIEKNLPPSWRPA